MLAENDNIMMKFFSIHILPDHPCWDIWILGSKKQIEISLLQFYSTDQWKHSFGFFDFVGDLK